VSPRRPHTKGTYADCEPYAAGARLVCVPKTTPEAEIRRTRIVALDAAGGSAGTALSPGVISSPYSRKPTAGALRGCRNHRICLGTRRPSRSGPTSTGCPASLDRWRSRESGRSLGGCRAHAYFISDPQTGWNLYRYEDKRVEPLFSMKRAREPAVDTGPVKLRPHR